MQQRQPDPFFEQLKADIQEGIDQADRGELIDETEVWKYFEIKANARKTTRVED
jgi:predicted transcriptional regulator